MICLNQKKRVKCDGPSHYPYMISFEIGKPIPGRENQLVLRFPVEFSFKTAASFTEIAIHQITFLKKTFFFYQCIYL